MVVLLTERDNVSMFSSGPVSCGGDNNWVGPHVNWDKRDRRKKPIWPRSPLEHDSSGHASRVRNNRFLLILLSLSSVMLCYYRTRHAFIELTYTYNILNWIHFCFRKMINHPIPLKILPIMILVIFFTAKGFCLPTHPKNMNNMILEGKACLYT